MSNTIYTTDPSGKPIPMLRSVEPPDSVIAPAADDVADVVAAVSDRGREDQLASRIRSLVGVFTDRAGAVEEAAAAEAMAALPDLCRSSIRGLYAKHLHSREASRKLDGDKRLSPEGKLERRGEIASAFAADVARIEREYVEGPLGLYLGKFAARRNEVAAEAAPSLALRLQVQPLWRPVDVCADVVDSISTSDFLGVRFLSGFIRRQAAKPSGPWQPYAKLARAAVELLDVFAAADPVTARHAAALDLADRIRRGYAWASRQMLSGADFDLKFNVQIGAIDGDLFNVEPYADET